MLACENALGASWVCDRDRWGYHPRENPDGTSDGFVPIRILWARYASLRIQHAHVALDTARAIGLILAKEESRAKTLRDLQADANPIDRGIAEG